MNSTMKNIIMFVGIFLVIGLGYWFFSSRGVNVNNIELEDSVLSNPVWNYLFDFSVDLEPEGEAGRINPFAPIGSDGSILPAEQSSKVPSANLLNNGGAGALIN